MTELYGRLLKNSPEEKARKWLERKAKIKEYLLSMKVNPYKLEVFMKYYSHRYDPWQKEFLDIKLCWLLFDDLIHTRKIGTRWYACVGTGGTGKSTLMQNVFYFLDPRFTLADSNLSMGGFVKRISDEKNIKSGRALFLDEPDNNFHQQTAIGKQFSDVLGKARQGKYFFGICATDLRDVGTTIYRKIDRIFFLPHSGRYFFYMNNPIKKDYIIQQIRQDYLDQGYQVFFNLSKEAVQGWTGKPVPFSRSEKASYLSSKKQDFLDSARKLASQFEKKRRAYW